MFLYYIVADVRRKPQDPCGKLSLYFFVFFECCFRRDIGGSIQKLTLSNICIISTSSFVMIHISRCGSYLACAIWMRLCFFAPTNVCLIEIFYLGWAPDISFRCRHLFLNCLLSPFVWGEFSPAEVNKFRFGRQLLHHERVFIAFCNLVSRASCLFDISRLPDIKKARSPGNEVPLFSYVLYFHPCFCSWCW